ncbi:hypothetical protein AXW83_15125 [Bosea sp. PAMC 26642]|nr:hypothetical protein AXW83_15125 [Bosea sp. PAMC 26642]
MVDFVRRSFSDGPTSLVTILALVVLIGGGIPLLNWALFNADFVGSAPADCRRVGACWVFISQKAGQLFYGFYPQELRWQVNASMVVTALGLIGAFAAAQRYQIALAGAIYALSVSMSFTVFGGRLPGMTAVPVEKWGGLTLTLLLFGIGVGVSFLFGGLLAMGRRSDKPLIRSIASVYVEFMRGVPLIAILFVAVILLPLFLPSGADANLFLRIVVGICLYTSSYMAEAIRAGLDAVPTGSREAAYALGLSRWNTQKLVVFPQALTISLPGLINTMVALAKDTSLVIIVGVHDLLGSTQLAIGDVSWGNVLWEGYFFAGTVYFLMCYVLNFIGRRLEIRARRTTAR